MKKKILALSVTLFFASCSTLLYAKGDASSGKDKTASCAGCHGENGNSMMPMFPKLAGQHSAYLVSQLTAFKNGSRDDATMAPMVMAFEADDFADMAAYYSTQQISSNEMPVLEMDDDDEDDEYEDDEQAEQGPDIDTLMAMGSDLYRNGDLEREVSACIACHGPFGEGNKPAGFPALKSQHADYLIKSLTDFKSGTRSNNPDNMMHMIATKMTDTEIKAVSYHISMMK